MALAAEGLVEENKLLLATNLSTGYLHVRNFLSFDLFTELPNARYSHIALSSTLVTGFLKMEIFVLQTDVPRFACKVFGSPTARAPGP